MIKTISNILVPIDFTENAEVAISKALEFCPDGAEMPTIHLLHVQQIVLSGLAHVIAGVVAGYSQRQVNMDIKASYDRLDLFKSEIGKMYPDIRIICWVTFGDPVQDSIIKKARQISADLIVIGKQSHHSLFAILNTVVPSKIAAITSIPVFTAKPGSLHKEIKTVVIPIGTQFPGSKLEILGALRSRFKPHIRLVFFPDDVEGSKDSKHLLLYTFRAFKSQFSNPINFEVLQAGNKVRQLLRYCNKVGADVLIVYPGAETKIRNWTNSHISDLLPAESKTQILSISPA